MNSPDSMRVVARLDGVLIPPTLGLLRPDDLGVLRGDGVFETTLAVNGFPRDLDKHLERLSVSARMIDLKLPGDDSWDGAIRAVLAGWAGGAEMVLRLIATRGVESGGQPTCFAMGSALGDDAVAARSAGVRVLLLGRGYSAADVATKPWLLAGAKTLSYATNLAALRHARAHGAEDVIFTGTDGTVLEGPTATVVLARGRSLLTPLREGILDGITARRLFAAAEAAGWSVADQPVTVDELHGADGVYLASSTRILAPVVAIDAAERENDPATTDELRRLLQMPGA